MGHQQSDIDWEHVKGIIQPAAFEVLAGGPRSLDDLTDELFRLGVLAEFELPGDELDFLVEEALIATDRTFTFDDGQVALIDQVLDGVVLTHRVTAGELDRGVLDVLPDFSGLMFGEREMPLVSGGGTVRVGYPFRGERHLHEHGSLVGPAGWLAGVEPDELVGMRYRARSLELLRRFETTADAGRAGDALRRTVDDLADTDETVDADILVLESALHDPALFRTPTLPISDLLDLVDLTLLGAWVGRAGERLTTPGGRFLEKHIDDLRQSYGLDDCCVAELHVLVDAYLEFVGAGPGRREACAAELDAARLRTAADHGAVTAAFGEFLNATGDGARDILDQYADALVTHEPLEPLGLYVRAVAALADSDAVAALAALEQAVGVDARSLAALDLCSVLLADAGRPVDALAMRRRVVAHGGPNADIASLQEILRQTNKIGRNDPCPCGSGRKHKQCCQRDPKLTTADRRRLALHQAARYSVDGDGRRDLFSLGLTAVGESGLPPEHFSDAIVGFATDPFIVDLLLYEGGRFDEYLDERAAIVPSTELDWLRAIAATPRSLWEGERHHDGTYRLRDVMAGTVHDPVRFAAGGPEPGSYALARVVADGSDGEPAAIGPVLLVPHSRRDRVIDLLDAAPDVHEWAAWFGGLAAPPTVTNREGDALDITDAFFTPPDGDWGRASTFLAQRFSAEGDDRWVQQLELGRELIVRASLRRTGDELVVSTNSTRRLGDIRDLLESEGFQFLRAVFPEPDDDGDVDDDCVELRPEDVDRIRDQMEDTWINDHVPALGGLTPLAAVNDPTRRRDVIALIEEFERRPQAGVGAYDFPRLRRKLGL